MRDILKEEGLYRFKRNKIGKDIVGHLFSNVVNQEQGNTIVKD